jgi:hypothetical protein
MAGTDLKGLSVSTTSSDALAAYERGVDLFLRWRAGAVDALDAAARSHPQFALAHCTGGAPARARCACRPRGIDAAFVRTRG